MLRCRTQQKVATVLPGGHCAQTYPIVVYLRANLQAHILKQTRQYEKNQALLHTFRLQLWTRLGFKGKHTSRVKERANCRRLWLHTRHWAVPCSCQAKMSSSTLFSRDACLSQCCLACCGALSSAVFSQLVLWICFSALASVVSGTEFIWNCRNAQVGRCYGLIVAWMLMFGVSDLQLSMHI